MTKLFTPGAPVYFESANGRDVDAVVLDDTGEYRVKILIEWLGMFEMPRHLLKVKV